MLVRTLPAAEATTSPAQLGGQYAGFISLPHREVIHVDHVDINTAMLQVE